MKKKCILLFLVGCITFVGMVLVYRWGDEGKQMLKQYFDIKLPFWFNSTTVSDSRGGLQYDGEVVFSFDLNQERDSRWNNDILNRIAWQENSVNECRWCLDLGITEGKWKQIDIGKWGHGEYVLLILDVVQNKLYLIKSTI